MSASVGTVRAPYRGCTLVIGPRTVDVYAPDGRYIGAAYTVSGARRIVRGYRNERGVRG